MNKKFIVIITGPTGVGKTKISIEIAKALNTEVISGDAYQVYQGMDIGTAKIIPVEMQDIPHHLIDIISATDTFSVCDYQTKVRNLCEEMFVKNKIPLIVGGSGLYLDSVIRDYRFDSPKRSNDDLYQNLSDEELHQLLDKLDPETGKTIHMNNRKRVLRAIELINTNQNESRTLKNEFVYDALVFFLTAERDILYKRINQRVDEMVENGLIDEVKSFYPNGLSLTSKGAIGYKELFSYFNNEITKEEAIEKIKQNSRHYAKRQMTWYRHQENTIFIDVDFNNYSKAINEILTLINQHMNKN